MIITDGMRLKLTERAREVFKDEGELLMQHLPVGGADAVVVKHEFTSVLTQLRSDIRKDHVGLFFSIAGLNIATFGLLLAAIKWI